MWQHKTPWGAWVLIRGAQTLADAVGSVRESNANSGMQEIREVQLVPVGDPVEVNTSWVDEE